MSHAETGDGAETSDAINLSTWVTPTRLSIGYLWIVAAVCALVLPSALLLLPRQTLDSELTAQIALGVVFAGIFGGVGLGVVLRWRWVRFVAVSLAVAALVTAVAALAVGLVVPGLALIVVFGPSLVLLHPQMQRAFLDETVRDSKTLSTALRRALLVTIGLAAIYVVESQFETARQHVELFQTSNECEESGDPEACGRAALLTILFGESLDEVTEALGQLDRLCDEDRPFACRFAGLARTREHAGVMRDGFATLRAHERKVLRRLCTAGNAEACFAQSREGRWAPQLGGIKAPAAKLCLGGEPLACKAIARLVQRVPHTLQDSLAAHTMACQAGFTANCQELGRDTAPVAPMKACSRGELWRCGVAAATQEKSETSRAALLALADASHQDANPALYGVKVPPDVDFMAGCRAGESVSCLVAGLKLLDGEMETWRPALPSLEPLDQTMGRSCELGFDGACVAYAMRLLNRPLDERPNVARANELLDIACQRGDERACWLYQVEGELLNGDVERYKEQALRACLATPTDKPTSSNSPCDELAGVISYELGATPWLLTDRTGYSHLRRTCAEHSDRLSCARLGRMHIVRRGPILSTGIPPLHIVAYDAASRACFQGEMHGCNEMLASTLSPQHPVPQSFGEMEADICERVPELCDELYK